jgi:hypothetical protein
MRHTRDRGEMCTGFLVDKLVGVGPLRRYVHKGKKVKLSRYRPGGALGVPRG